MKSADSLRASFDLTGRVAVITGGAGLLGGRHAEAIAEMGGIPVLIDIDGERARARAIELLEAFNVQSIALEVDITNQKQVSEACDHVVAEFGRLDILINNAANDPKMGPAGVDNHHWSRLEQFPLEIWERDIAVGLTGAFLCSRIIGTEMARRKRGVILNIASDLGMIAPDQRIYRQPGLEEEQQPVKPVTYSIVKHGIIGLTRYLATYWADRGIRVNALSPGGVYNDQDESFVKRLTPLIPMQRMAGVDEYKAAVVFLVSDASSYMTGANLVIDGGRTAW